MLNKVVLIGRLTKDVELRYTPNGNATCSFTLACDRQFKNAQGEKETDFIPCNVPPFKKELAELCANYLGKGKMAAVDGSIQIRTYNDKDGQKRWATEVIATDVRFLSPKDGEGHAQTQPQGNPPPYQQPQPTYQQQPGQPTYQQQPGATPYPGQYGAPGYGQPSQGQWQGQPPQGYGQPPGQQPPHPNMPNPNFPNQQPQGQPGAGASGIGKFGHEVTLDDDIPF